MKIYNIRFKYFEENDNCIGICPKGDPDNYTPIMIEGKHGKKVLLPLDFKGLLDEEEVYHLTGYFKDHGSFFVFVPTNLGTFKKILATIERNKPVEEKTKSFFSFFKTKS